MKVRHKYFSHITGTAIGLTTKRHMTGYEVPACIVIWDDPKSTLNNKILLHNLVFIVPCR